MLFCLWGIGLVKPENRIRMSNVEKADLKQVGGTELPPSLLLAFFSGSRLMHHEMVRVHLCYLHEGNLYPHLDLQGYYDAIDELAAKGWIQIRSTDAIDISLLSIHPQLMARNKTLLDQLDESIFQSLLLAFCSYYDEFAIDFDNWFSDRHSEPLLLAAANLDHEIINLHRANELMIIHNLDFYVVFSVLEKWYMFHRNIKQGLDLCRNTKELLDSTSPDLSNHDDQSLLEDYLYVCHALATFQMRSGDFVDSKTTLENTIRDFHYYKFQDEPESTMLGDLHRALGETLIDLKDHETAEQHLRLAFDFYQGRAHDIQWGTLFSDLSDIYRERHDSAQAYQYSLKALEHYQNASDGNSVADTLFALGVIARELMNFPQSILHLEQAIDGYLEYKAISEIGEIYNELGLTYICVDDLGKAISSFKNSVEYAKMVGDERTEMVALGNLATVRYAEQDEEVVNDYLQIVQAGMYKIAESGRVISLLNALAEVVIREKKYSKATALLDRADLICETIHDDQKLYYSARILYLRGSICLGLDQIEQAISVWQLIIPMVKLSGDAYLQSQVHYKLALAWIMVEKNATARYHIEEMLKAAVEQGEFARAERLCDAGMLERSMQKPDKALVHFRSAEAVSIRINEAFLLAEVNYNIGSIELIKNELKEAHSRLEAAISWYDQIQDEDGKQKCQLQLRLLYEQKQEEVDPKTDRISVNQGSGDEKSKN